MPEQKTAFYPFLTKDQVSLARKRPLSQFFFSLTRPLFAAAQGSIRCETAVKVYGEERCSRLFRCFILFMQVAAFVIERFVKCDLQAGMNTDEPASEQKYDGNDGDDNQYQGFPFWQNTRREGRQEQHGDGQKKQRERFTDDPSNLLRMSSCDAFADTHFSQHHGKRLEFPESGNQKRQGNDQGRSPDK